MKWITRERPKIDRIACPWLIKNFVDAEAEFIYVPKDQVFAKATELGAIPYDIPGAVANLYCFSKRKHPRQNAVSPLMQTVQFRDLGQMDYQAAWDFQTALHRHLVENKLNNRDLKPGTYPQEHQLLFVEHPPVYTLGKSGSMDNLLLSEAELSERGIQFFPINRGGDITFHGPGQIVGYPLLDLECFFTDVHKYVRNIEEVIIRTLAEYGLETFRIKDYTGVWVNGAQPATGNRQPATSNRKICAIGVHLSRWVTLHGWAFNINTPLEYFDFIVPCGIADKDKTVTSLAAELGRPVDLHEVKEKLKRHFADVFECEVV